MGVLHLVRHGQASFGTDDYDVLSADGHEQARILGRWLVGAGGWDAAPATIVHGGMRRHRETWEGIAEGAGWSATANEDADWAEFDFVEVLAHHERLTGEHLGTDADRRAFQQHFEVATGHWSSYDGDERYPEPYADFVARARAALERAAATPGPVLVVTSGGVIAALAATLVAPDPLPIGPVWARFNTVLANTSVSRVIVGPTGARLLTFNEHPHLDRKQITYR